MVLIWLVINVVSDEFHFKMIFLSRNLASFNFVKIYQISFAVFFSSTPDKAESANVRCTLVIALTSISFYFSSGSLYIYFLMPLDNCPYWIFRNVKLLSMNFSISKFVTISSLQLFLNDFHYYMSLRVGHMWKIHDWLTHHNFKKSFLIWRTYSNYNHRACHGFKRPFNLKL